MWGSGQALSSWKAAIGKKLRELRLARGMSLQEVADAIGSAREYVRRVEMGHVSVGVDSLEKICRALDVKMSDLFTEPADAEEPEVVFLRQRGFDQAATRQIKEFMDFIKQRQKEADDK